MAFNRASGLLNWTLDKLSIFHQSQVVATSDGSSNPALEDDVKHLERTMKRIQSILLDAPEEGILDRSEKHRLEELREVAYDAEDLVEEYEYEVLHAKVQARNNMEATVTTDLSFMDVSVPVPEAISMRAKAIRKRYDEIIGEWENLRWVESDGAKKQSRDIVKRTPSSSLVYEPYIRGRFKDKEKIIAILLNIHGDGRLNQIGPRVLPIVGMGGVGKTTLAQLVYNDSRMDIHFDMKVWICVSKEFDVMALTQAIIAPLNKEPCDAMQLDDLQMILLKKIKDKRVLIVLDDVWNERYSLWYLLRAPFYASLSCRILVTTRNEKVAKMMQTVSSYPLRCLEQEDSWQLFKQVAFENQELGEQSDLLEIGMEVATKCGGLPLAIKAWK